MTHISGKQIGEHEAHTRGLWQQGVCKESSGLKLIVKEETLYVVDDVRFLISNKVVFSRQK